MMTFPDTWEEFEKLYGFNDVEEIYTNNSRLIPSFRVKQWLDHLPSVQQEQLDCEDCIKNGGDWECDRVHCHKGDAISRTAAIDAADRADYTGLAIEDVKKVTDEVVKELKRLPSVQPETAKRIVGKSRDGMTLWYQCDMCNEPVDMQDNYCRGCGRRLIDE